MSSIIVTKDARSDLRAIAIYIARDNPERATSFVEELISKISSVGDRPLTYPAKEDLRNGLRSAAHGRYRILFKIDDKSVVILRVLHGARDIRSIIGADDE
jgi:toxin ParE1/3/4